MSSPYYRLLNLLGLTALLSLTQAQSVSVNFSPLPTSDAEAVNAGEVSVIGIPGTETIDGSKWNNVRLRPTATSGSPTNFITATQGGNRIDLISSLGSDSGINMTSVSSSTGLFANYGNTSNPNSATTGDGGLMQGILLLDSTESVRLDGLATWAPNGYRVYAFFDIGNATRTYGLTMADGVRSQTFWTADTPIDADANNDGVIDWLATSATTAETAVANANHAIFGIFTGDVLTISGTSAANRSALSGFQIVRNTVPIASVTSFTVTPAVFTPGQSVTLSWNVQNADSISIDQGIGTVGAVGSRVVTPANSTKWTLSAIRSGTTLTADVAASVIPAEIDVYLLGGQSNMLGTALSTSLPPAQLSMPEILFYVSGREAPTAIAGKVVTLQPANGSTFGLEIGIGERLRSLRPGRPMALIKFADGGTSLEIGWKPGTSSTNNSNWGPQYKSFVATVNGGLAALEAAGWVPVIRGMCWQQGEQDAKDGLDADESTTSADDYGANLSAFIGRVRQQFANHAGPGGIRFVTGQVLPFAPSGGDVATRFPGRALVRQAILNADEGSGASLSVANTEAIPTNQTDHPSHEQVVDGYRDDDEVHQSATALIAIGRSMAYALLKLDPQSYTSWAAGRGLVGGRNFDDDDDGLSNVQEYIFGGNPKLRSDAPRPRIDTNTSAARYVVPWNREATELIPSAEFSPDLVNWSSQTPVAMPISELPDGTSFLNYEIPRQIGNPAPIKGFFRTRHVSR
jgi:Carbohydrate esterase, sialic acid-specific acetylesterase